MRSDELTDLIKPIAQATLGRLATAHPWLAGLALVAGSIGVVLGLASGLVPPSWLTTPRRRALSRIALRFGVAARGSFADIEAAVKNVDPPVPAAPDPIAVAATSLPAAPVPTELIERTRLPGHGSPPRTADEMPPSGPVRLPPVVSGARPVSRQSLPREEPLTVPPPAVAPGLRRPESLRRLPTPETLSTTMPLPSRPGSRRRHETPPAVSVEDPEETPPEGSRPHAGHHADSVRGRDRGRG